MPREPHHHHVEVLIIGGGQAGLSLSYLLKQQGLSHVILEKNRLGHAWRSERWDSFCLVTPNWQCALPGFPYQGDDPEGLVQARHDAQVGDPVQRVQDVVADPAQEGAVLHQAELASLPAQLGLVRARAGDQEAHVPEPLDDAGRGHRADR